MEHHLDFRSHISLHTADIAFPEEYRNSTAISINFWHFARQFFPNRCIIELDKRCRKDFGRIWAMEYFPSIQTEDMREAKMGVSSASSMA